MALLSPLQRPPDPPYLSLLLPFPPSSQALVPGVSDSELQSALTSAQRHPHAQPQHTASAGAPVSCGPVPSVGGGAAGARTTPTGQRSGLESQEVLARRVFSVSVGRVLQQPWLQRRAAAGAPGAPGSGAGPSAQQAAQATGHDQDEDIAAAWSQLTEAQRLGFTAAVGPGLARLEARQRALGRALSEAEVVAELEGFVVAPDQEAEGQQEERQGREEEGEEEGGRQQGQGREDKASSSSSSDGSSDGDDSDSDTDSSSDSGSEGEWQEGRAANVVGSGHGQGREKRQRLESRSLLQLLTAAPPEGVGA